MKLNILFEGAREDSAIDLMRKLIYGTEYYGKVWIAGGYVRDELLGKQPKDIDLVIDMPNGGIKFANWICHKLNIYKEGSNPVTYPRFGTAMFNFRGVVHNGNNLNGVDIECIAPRKDERAEGKTRKDVITAFGSMEDDAKRRDLTINALYKNVSTGKILDPLGSGVDDLQNKYLRTPTDPNSTFGNPPQGDPLRMLRAIRFHVKFGYDLDPDIISAIKNNVRNLENISNERIRDEFCKMLATDRPVDAVRLLMSTGLMKYIIPELYDMVGMEQGIYHNKDGFEHTIDVLGGTPPDLTLRLAALLHDIGKPDVRSPHPKKKFEFIEHDKVGSEKSKHILRRLKFPNNIIDKVSMLIRNHMGLRATLKDIPSNKSLRKFARKCGTKENLYDALLLMQADRRAHPGHENSNVFDVIRDRYEKLEDEGEVVSKTQRLISGNEIMDILEIPQGPEVGAALDYVQELVDNDPSVSKEEAIDKLKDKFGE